MTKSAFLLKLANAAARYKQIPVRSDFMLQAEDCVRAVGLPIREDNLVNCPIVSAVLAARYCDDDPLDIFAAAEAAWESFNS